MKQTLGSRLDHPFRFDKVFWDQIIYDVIELFNEIIMPGMSKQIDPSNALSLPTIVNPSSGR